MNTRVVVKSTNYLMCSRFINKLVMPPVNLLSASGQEVRKFMESFDHVFSDCDGAFPPEMSEDALRGMCFSSTNRTTSFIDSGATTGVLWMTVALPGVSDFVKLMKMNGKTMHYISNNSIRSRENYEAQFKNAGIENGYENLTIPSIAMADYLKSIKFDKHVYCVSCAEARKTLEAQGFKCKYGPDIVPDSMEDFRQYLIDDPEIGAVVFDSDFKVNMPKMYKAYTYLKRPEVLLISGPTDKLVPFGDYGVGLGVSVFTNTLAEMANRVPIGMGKPAKAYGEFAMKRAGITDPSRVLFIGDMIEQDIALGKNVGFKTMLVLSQFTEEQMLAHDIQPDYYAPSLGSIVPKLKEQSKI